MAARLLPKAYVDSCVLINWIDPETPRDVFEPIDWLIEEFKAKKLTLVMSTITAIEVLEVRNTPEAFQNFKILQGNPDIIWIPCNIRVVEWSTELRNLLLREKEGGKKITTSTPDSIHLASGLYAGCEVFYTTDGINAKEKLERKLLPLQNLEFKGRKMRIAAPTIPPDAGRSVPGPEPTPPYRSALQDSLFGEDADSEREEEDDESIDQD